MIFQAAKTLATVLDSAMLEAREIERLSATHPELNEINAYDVQAEGIHLREQRGEKRVGFKMGFTSEAKRQQMGLGSPIYGVLTDRMRVATGEFSIAGKIHPKIEPEIAFILERDLRGRVTAEQALAACSGVCAAMEILDSRFMGFKYFSLPDVIADNASSSYYILSREIHPVRGFELGDLEMKMEVDGQLVQSARSSAISGHPINSLVQLCELLDARGLFVPAGSVVLAGAATAAVPITSGMRVRATVEKLGSVEVSVR